MKIISDFLKEQKEVLDGIEIQQAPSGEWAEYNIEHLVQSAIVNGLETAEYLIEDAVCANCKFYDDTHNMTYCNKHNLEIFEWWDINIMSCKLHEYEEGFWDEEDEN